MKYNMRYEVIASVDQAGILEYWTAAKYDYKFPAKIVSFESKMDTGKTTESQSDGINPSLQLSSIVYIFRFV